MLSITTIRQFVQTHPRRVALIVVAVLIYAVLNVWVYRSTTSGNASASWLTPIAAIQSFFTKKLPEAIKSGGFPADPTPIRVDTDKSLAPQFREAKLKPTPTPTPRPTGPGQFACSPEGVCNLYSDAVRSGYCTTTYADSLCLDQCGDKGKQCAK